MERFFFIENKDYKVNDKIEISGIEHNHISKVLRMKIGDKIVCLPNNGLLIYCEIVSFSKQVTICKVEKIEQSSNECDTSLTVFVPLLKSDKFEFLITKLTELGVKKIVPFVSTFMTAKQGNDKTERFIQIGKDACKQCRRAKIIEIGNLLAFDEMLKTISTYDMTIFAYENEKTSKLKDINLNGCQNVAMIVGSEGGFSEKEAEQISNSGAKTVSLGKRILRAETAVITLASILQYELNEI
ncbi:MAG: RsmE family RNA methyltransferase [Christensenellales bacterium]